MAGILKILSHKNTIKPWFSWKIWWGSKKPLEFSRFLLLKKKKFAYLAWNLKILSHKNAIKPWFSWKIWWGSKKPLKFSRFLLLGKKILLILLEIWKIPQLFATDIRWSLEKFDFLRKISDFYQFCHFRSPFSPTFRHGPKVKPWKIWFLDQIEGF